MTCPRCRPSPPLPFPDAVPLYKAHRAAGLRQAQCHACGLWRWPWEWEEPERRATGLTWQAVRVRRCRVMRVWELRRGGRRVGVCIRYIGDREWTARVDSVDPWPRLLTSGSLSGCARALVRAVSGPPGSGER